MVSWRAKRIAFVVLIVAASSRAFAEVSFPLITIGNLGNPADTAVVDGKTYGSVSHSYQISAVDVTNSQYVEFLNKVDPSGANSLDLYFSFMTSNSNGGIIQDLAAPTGSRYTVKTGFQNKPVNYVSFLDAMRFVNWLNNGQGNGGTETGAYTLTLGGLAPRNPAAIYFIPSEDEWYKAAYYDPTKAALNKYDLYGTHSDELPVASTPSSAPNHANYGGVSGITDVGAYTDSTSYYGLFDMSGNVWQWNDSIIDGVARGLRGGSFAETGTPNIGSMNRFSNTPTASAPMYGFRVAAADTVPEPGSLSVLALASLPLVIRRRRGTSQD